jgi:hypothetical protein
VADVTSQRRFLTILAGAATLVTGSLCAQGGEPITAFGLSDNGRRFMVNGKGVFLAGFREGYVGGDWDPVYWNQTSLPANHPISPDAAEVDYNAYAAAILASGMNLVRCNLIHMVAGSGRVHGSNERPDAYNSPPSAPFTERPWARTGGGQAWDGLQKYNLREWNPRYWQRLADWVRTANHNGIVVEVILFHQHNYYQLFTHYADNPFRPWNCTPDTGLPNEFGRRAYPEYYGNAPGLRAAQEQFVDKVLDTIGRYPGVIYRVACEYNWTDAWVDDWAARIKKWGMAHGSRLVVQVGGSMQQMKLMKSNVDSMDGQYCFRQASGTTCDPPSIVETRLAGFCQGRGFRNDAATVHATLLWMWSDLPDKAVVRDSDAEVAPGRMAWWAALTGGAAGYCYHGYVRTESKGEASVGTTRLIGMTRVFDRMAPHDHLVAAGNAYVLAAPGEEYLAYLPSGGTARIDLGRAAGSLRYDWFNPRTFVLSNGGSVGGGRIQSFIAPDDSDWALWIRSNDPERRSPESKSR